MQFGVIDLGTNTFHLLIVETEGNGQFKELHRERKYVKLAEDGIETIGAVPFQRGVEAMIHYREIMDTYNLDGFKAFGTAGLRRASNSREFINTIKENTGIEIEVISGSKEALYIYEGTKLAVPMYSENCMVMDIGGGSVEFVLANAEGVFWERSFPIGVAVLWKKFHHTEPIAEEEVSALVQFLDEILQPLFEQSKEFKPVAMIGASGTFDVVNSMIDPKEQQKLYSRFSARYFKGFYNKILPANFEERMAMDKMPPSRADMAVAATVLIDFIIKKCHIRDIVVSKYAMKEGILSELMQEAIR